MEVEMGFRKLKRRGNERFEIVPEAVGGLMIVVGGG